MWRRILTWVLAVGAIAGGIALGYEPAGVLLFLFIILRPIEKLWPRHRTPLRRLGLRTDITHLLLTPLTQVAGIAVGLVIGIVSLAWLPGLAVRPLVTALPFWVQAGLGFLLIAIAAAIAGDPQLLVLDEPDAHLDEGHRDELGSRLRERATTVVFSTHDRQWASDVADRIVELRDGRVVSRQ